MAANPMSRRPRKALLAAIEKAVASRRGGRLATKCMADVEHALDASHASTGPAAATPKADACAAAEAFAAHRQAIQRYRDVQATRFVRRSR